MIQINVLSQRSLVEASLCLAATSAERRNSYLAPIRVDPGELRTADRSDLSLTRSTAADALRAAEEVVRRADERRRRPAPKDDGSEWETDECETCHGEGEIHFRHDPGDPRTEDFDRCPDCIGTGRAR